MTTSAKIDFFTEFATRIEEFIPSEEKRNEILRMLFSFKEQKANIMITGATGSGKSSTINALFNTEKARVGCTPNPETMDIRGYELDGVKLWDTPGLGDGKEADTRHAKMIVDKLNETDSDGNMVIDAVLVVLDAGSRDLGTSYALINDVIIPQLQDRGRVIIAINQADMAMKGRNWNRSTNTPEPPLARHLETLAATVRRRILDSTGVDIVPVCYCAGYKEDGGDQMAPYNLDKLLCLLLGRLPAGKRMNTIHDINTEKIKETTNDGAGTKNGDKPGGYKSAITDSFRAAGREIGEKIGGVFGSVGRAVGGAIGEAVGGLVGWLFG